MTTPADNAALDNGQSVKRSETESQSDRVTSATSPLSEDKKEVSPRYVQNQSEPSVWLFMRAAYGQEKKACEYLQKEGIEVFCPQCVIEKIINNKRQRVLASLIPSSLFVHSTEEIMKQYVGRYPVPFLHHHYHRDAQAQRMHYKRSPIIIPDHQMRQFQLWASVNHPDKYFRSTPYEFKQGENVRITDGPFLGMTGKVVRIKGNTRVGINIDGIGFIATSYIPKSLIERI